MWHLLSRLHTPLDSKAVDRYLSECLICYSTPSPTTNNHLVFSFMIIYIALKIVLMKAIAISIETWCRWNIMKALDKAKSLYYLLLKILAINLHTKLRENGMLWLGNTSPEALQLLGEEKNSTWVERKMPSVKISYISWKVPTVPKR